MRTFAQKQKVSKQTASAKSTISDRVDFGQSREANSILHLQRTIGNQAMQSLPQAGPDGFEAFSDAVAPGSFGHDFYRIPVHAKAAVKIQPKLAVNTPGDIYEEEADRIAEQVMRMSEPKVQSQQSGVSVLISQSYSGENIQRLAANRNPSLEDSVEIEGEESEAGQVQTLRPPSQESGREAISKGLLNSSQGGVPLGSNVRQFMEPRFGADFSSVQVHADSRAAALSQSISARAFTYGRHIYFNEDEYQPETQEGKRVLAHELTHVIQQGGNQTRLPIQQVMFENRGANAPATIQRLSKLGKELRHNVAPWGSGPTGSDYEVSTDTGSTLSGWRAYPVWKDEVRYWCHGHSLGTFDKYGYSVYSGPPMQTVVKDEWTNIAPDKTQAGDIAVWTAGFDHSAKFTKPVIEKGQLMPDKSELSTKNGQDPLAMKTLTNIAGTYGPAGIGVFRHK